MVEGGFVIWLYSLELLFCGVDKVVVDLVVVKLEDAVRNLLERRVRPIIQYVPGVAQGLPLNSILDSECINTFLDIAFPISGAFVPKYEGFLLYEFEIVAFLYLAFGRILVIEVITGDGEAAGPDHLVGL